MSREGFMLFAMGFTGKEALRWNLADIAAFNRMGAEQQSPMIPPASNWPHSLAAQAAAQFTQTVFEAILSIQKRHLLNFGYAIIPNAMKIAKLMAFRFKTEFHKIALEVCLLFAATVITVSVANVGNQSEAATPKLFSALS